ncbi:MAG: hypothetical protein EOP22_13795 [Hyphomicrobiales bacterium]|nr:MAG: hypothetical protein EOP22_13795 [Hyphomicrobiales bacterium]
MKASAFVVGPRDGAAATLMDLARSIGFANVQRYQGLSRAEAQSAKTPLLFFLCSPVADVKSLQPMASAIRFSPSLKLRFLPMIYFAREPSLDTVKACIGMGFDDVIALPISGDEVVDRIARQIGSITTYYETASYFGPDRRNRLGGNFRPTSSDHGGGAFRRIAIRRNPETGVDVLSDDQQVVV